jgi:hypothetical protein
MPGIGLAFSKFCHTLRHGSTSFERRFREEFEESLHVLRKTGVLSLSNFPSNRSKTRMLVSPHLPVPHVEKLADLLVLPLPNRSSDKPWNNT